MSARNGSADAAGMNGSVGSRTAVSASDSPAESESSGTAEAAGPAADGADRAQGVPGDRGEAARLGRAAVSDPGTRSGARGGHGARGRRAALERLGASVPGLVARSLAADSVDAVWSLFVNMIAGSPLMPRVGRILIYRLAGMRIGRTQVYSQVTFGRPWVTFGDDCMVNRGCVFDNLSRVTFGSKVRVGQEAMFCTSTHDLGGPQDRASVPATSAPIVVGDGCWIGSRAVLLPGVTVGDGCVVAAGAVVAKDCEPNGLYAGVPARRVRDLPV